MDEIIRNGESSKIEFKTDEVHANTLAEEIVAFANFEDGTIVGSTIQTPTQQELLRLFQKRNMIQFDETPDIKASVESIDIGKVNRYPGRLGQSQINEENKIFFIHGLINLSILVDVDKVFYPTL